jgi:hypothetical protein
MVPHLYIGMFTTHCLLSGVNIMSMSSQFQTMDDLLLICLYQRAMNTFLSLPQTWRTVLLLQFVTVSIVANPQVQILTAISLLALHLHT